MPTNSDTPYPAFRLVARLALLLWAGFWTWFMVSVMAGEGVALEPVAMLSGLWAVTVLAWFRPRLGAVALVALSAWALWLFRNGAAVWLIALPACAIAAVAWLGSRPRRLPGRPGQLACGTLLALLAGAAGASSCANPPLAPPELPFGARTVERRPDGTIAKGRLAADTVIHGIPCRGWVRLHADGSLSSCELAATTTVQGHALPASSYLWLDEHSRLQDVWLSTDTVILGFTCRGGPWKTATSFHPDGSLRAFFPREDVVVDGVPCLASGQAPVYLHPNGRLAACRLAAEVTLDGRVLPRGSDVRFDDRARPAVR